MPFGICLQQQISHVRAMSSNFKATPWVSSPIRRFARGQACTLRMPWCNNDHETTVLCHIRVAGFNGWGMKPLDIFGYHGCSECHRRESEAGNDDIQRAMMETQTRLYEAGLIVEGKNE